MTYNSNMYTHNEFGSRVKGMSFVEELALCARALVPAMRLALELVSRDMLVQAGSFGFGPRFSNERCFRDVERPEGEEGLRVNLSSLDERFGDPKHDSYLNNTQLAYSFGKPFPFTVTPTPESSTSNR